MFPDADALAGAPDAAFTDPGPAARAASAALAAAVAEGRLDLEPGSDRDDARRRLEALPGIGPWTASYVAMRALGDPDVFLPTDLGVRHALERLGRGPARPRRRRGRALVAVALLRPAAPVGHARGPGDRDLPVDRGPDDPPMGPGPGVASAAMNVVLIVLAVIVVLGIVVALALNPLLNKKGDAAIARCKEVLGADNDRRDRAEGQRVRHRAGRGRRAPRHGLPGGRRRPT